MNEDHIAQISNELKLQVARIRATAELLGEGGTVPFIARYRKEATGTMDEVAITQVRDRLEQLAELDKRRDAILKSLTERELLTDDLKKKLGAAQNITTLEDIYLPYRPKRRTRATMAREKGLEPLALLLLDHKTNAQLKPHAAAAPFVNPEKGAEDVDQALAGARDIIAESINEDAATRADMRLLFQRQGIITSGMVKGKDDEGAKFKDYFEWNEPLAKAPSHRVLAMFRGEKEGFLNLQIAPPPAAAHNVLHDHFVQNDSPAARQVQLALEDSYKRLLAPSMETETRADMKQRADVAAIQVFADNLRELLLASPMGQKSVLALDPGFRTGCKVVCLDQQGKLLHNDVVYPHSGAAKRDEAAQKILALCHRFKMEAIAIGNGTAGRETETFVRGLGLPAAITIVLVNESGASVYSASKVARDEFPDHDLTVRGAVSIGRRLMDPLAELVKIDAKSIGVGQYQHDVEQNALKAGLDDVVVSCVNGVGVDLNTASKELLTYVSGLGPQIAGNIVAFRDENGPFPSRARLKKVARLGPKAFEQAAGFLRIRDGKNPLDASAVHPESYSVVDAMAKDLGSKVTDLMQDASLREKVKLQNYVTDTIGLPTLNDILQELAKPGRDPRAQFEAFSFTEGIEKVEDLKVGMKLPGIITNVTAFGAFVDVGVHQDGLVHISQLADQFVKNPADIVKVQQQVSVTVMEIDLPRKRIALSMKKDPFNTQSPHDKAKKTTAPHKKETAPLPRTQKQYVADDDWREKLKNFSLDQ
jgi:uncharacterized protein